jgi:hypothetical protein
VKTRQIFYAHLTENDLHVGNMQQVRHIDLILFREIIGAYCKILQSKRVCMHALKADRRIATAEWEGISGQPEAPAALTLNWCRPASTGRVVSVVRIVGRDSSAGIATLYAQDGSGIESRWRRGFAHPVQTGRGAHPATCTVGTGSVLGVKRPGRGVDHPPTPNAEVKERVELYLYSPSGPSWPVLR